MRKQAFTRYVALQRIALEKPSYGRPRITAELRRWEWRENPETGLPFDALDDNSGSQSGLFQQASVYFNPGMGQDLQSPNIGRKGIPDAVANQNQRVFFRVRPLHNALDGSHRSDEKSNWKSVKSFV